MQRKLDITMAKINGVAVKAFSQSILTKGRGKANKVNMVPLNEVFRAAQSGAVISLETAGNAFHPAYNGLVRVKRSIGRSGRPASLENTNWDLPIGSTTLVLECLDKSGRQFTINWRRDVDSLVRCDVTDIPAAAETRDTVTHKAWQHAVSADAVIPVTPESHQLAAGGTVLAESDAPTVELSESDATVMPSETVAFDASMMAALPAPATKTE